MKQHAALKTTLILLLVLVTAGIAAAFTMVSTYSGDGSLIVNGRKQNVLESQEWGSFIIDSDNMGSLQYDTTSGGDFRVSTPNGVVVFDKQSNGVTYMRTPDSTSTIERKTEDLVVTFRGKAYTFRLWSKPDEINLNLGSDQIKVEYKGISGYYTITGNLGQVIYKPMDTWNTCSVTSPAGTTTYKVVDQANQVKGFEMTGPAPSAHPYRFNGVEFYDEKYGIGIYVNLADRMNYPPMPKQFLVNQIILIK